MKNKKQVIILLASMVLMFFSVFLYKAVDWTNLNFSDLSFGQILFHLKVPLVGTDTSIIESFIEIVVMPTLKISLIFIGINLIHDKFASKLKFNLVLFSKSKRLKPLTINVFPGIISAIPATLFSLILIGLALSHAHTYFDFFGYLSDQITQSSFIEKNYVNPSEVLIFPEEKKNLIYIYLESMENTFASRIDGGAFTENYIPELTDLAKENVTFSNKDAVLGGNPQTVGTGWTMAAMFSHSTGLPLKVPVQGNSLSEISTFFPGVTSIGQVLKEEGYKNYLMVGSDATFGGRRNFYTAHGDYEILDYDVAIEKQIIPEDYKVFWGFEDEILYSWAKEELLEISKQPEPFNFTMLTVDTHHEDGYVCSLCEEEYDDQYANVIACASRQIDDFIKWIQLQDFYENTSIVIVGDHLTMDSDFKKNVYKSYTSTTYNTFINSGISVTEDRLRNRDFYAFDLFPTTLASLGIEIMGDRVALGTNLFSDKETLFEINGESMREELSKKSRYYDAEFLYRNKNNGKKLFNFSRQPLK